MVTYLGCLSFRVGSGARGCPGLLLLEELAKREGRGVESVYLQAIFRCTMKFQFSLIMFLFPQMQTEQGLILNGS